MAFVEYMPGYCWDSLRIVSRLGGTIALNIIAFQSAGKALYKERKDLQAAFASPDSLEYWAWCNSHGFFENTELARLAPPLPPEDLRAQIGAGTDPHGFLTSGEAIFLAISKLVNLGESRAILDFGCGCGRLLRFLSLYSGQADMVGVDVEPRHVQWACSNLKSASFAVNEKLPPLPFPSARFDTVISLSVFSHLPEPAHKAWMEELARVLALGVESLSQPSDRRPFKLPCPVRLPCDFGDSHGDLSQSQGRVFRKRI